MIAYVAVCGENHGGSQNILGVFDTESAAEKRITEHQSKGYIPSDWYEVRPYNIETGEWI